MRKTPLFFAAAFALSAIVGASVMFATAAQKAATKDETQAANLAHEIRHQLSVLPYYSVFDHIAFTLNGATVTLSGQVLRPTLKADAEVAVRSLEGVTDVANHIEVLPTSPPDDELRRAVYRAIYEDAALARYAVHTVPAIHIIIRDGTVTLEGIVDTPGDKRVAATKAASVANVVAVRNNLIVQSKTGAGE